MLELLGLSADPEIVYRHMLAQPNGGIDQLASALGWPTDRVRASLDQLAQLSLLRPSQENPDFLRAISPEVGLAALLARQEAELAERQQRIADSRRAVAVMVADLADLRPGRAHDEIEQLRGIDTVRNRIEELVHGCAGEIASFIPSGSLSAANIEASRPLDHACALRGIHTRDIYLDSVRNDPTTMTYLRWLTGQGVQVRTTASLPLRMTIFDGRQALIPIDPENSWQGAVLQHGRGIVAALGALFEQTWRSALPLSRDRQRDEAGLTSQEREVLRLLLAGQTDEGVARKLDISVRTGRRITADLMERLGARSRFQAGARAVERGWIEGD